MRFLVVMEMRKVEGAVGSGFRDVIFPSIELLVDGGEREQIGQVVDEPCRRSALVNMTMVILI